MVLSILSNLQAEIQTKPEDNSNEKVIPHSPELESRHQMHLSVIHKTQKNALSLVFGKYCNIGCL